MISRLNIKNKIDMFEFVQRVKDKYEDYYITKNKSRLMINDLKLIENILKTYEVYGLDSNGLKGILIIIRDKGFRPYIKLLTENSKYTIDFLKWIKWNYFEKDLYMKLKKNNPLTQTIRKTGFIKIGNRGNEDLFFKKGLKQLFKITAKDEYLPKEEHRLY